MMRSTSRLSTVRCGFGVLRRSYQLKPGGLLVLDGANRYLSNRFEGGFTTIQHTRSEPLNDEWRRFANRLRDWRAMNTSDGLWDTRLWVKPGSPRPGS